MRYSTSCSHEWDHAREEFLSIAKEQAREQSLQMIDQLAAMLCCQRSHVRPARSIMRGEFSTSAACSCRSKPTASLSLLADSRTVGGSADPLGDHTG